MLFQVRKQGRNKAEAAKPEPIELLRIVLDPASNQLSVWLAERPIASADQIADKGLRAQVQGLLTLLTPERDEPETTVTPAQTTPSPVQPSEAVRSFDGELSAPFLTRLTESLRRQRAYQPVAAMRLPKASKSAKAVHETNVVADMFAQVDAILQRKLREQPNAPYVEIGGEGVEPLIRVGSQVYRQIDAIPDEGVRSQIRSAVAEWEAYQFRSLRRSAAV